MSVLSQPQFHDEAAAFAWLENTIWNGAPVCPHCGGLDRISKIKPNPAARVRIGLHRCGDCKKQFTVKVGTVFEHARMPLHKMLQAVHLMCSSKKGISAHQLHRILEVQYKTAWFLAHRIREAMRDGTMGPLGGEGGMVEADETYFGKVAANKVKAEFVNGKGWVKRYTGGKDKMKVVSLVERSGRARSMVVDFVTANRVSAIVRENINPAATLMTDESNVYTRVGKEFAGHLTVNHKVFEWGRGAAHTNTIEGFFSIFKRGMKGVYQHCGEHHLHRYLAEFDFRYSNRERLGVNDQARSARAAKGIVGKRLTYRRPDEPAPF